MAPRENPSRFHPYDANKKPRIHRSNDGNSTTTKKNRTHHSIAALQQPKLAQSNSSGLSINDLKRRIRDVKRLLSRANLSPEARIIQERALKGYEKDLKDEQDRRQRSEMIKKYHFVRFLDRKTATKELRKAQRQCEKLKQQEKGDVESIAKLQQKIEHAQINVNYTIYYPLTEKYTSLYPQDRKRHVSNASNESDVPTTDDEMQTSDNEDSATEQKQPTDDDEKPPMWHIVRKCMTEGTLDQLRDGRLNIGFDGKPIQSEDRPATTTGTNMDMDDTKTINDKGNEKKKKEKGKKALTESKQNRGQKEANELRREDEGDSDGGFFEE